MKSRSHPTHTSQASRHSGRGPRRRIAQEALETLDPALLLAVDGRVLWRNDAARDLDADAALDGPSPEKLLPFWTELDGRTAVLEKAFSGEGLHNHEVRFLTGDAEPRERVFWISARMTTDGSDACAVLVARDVSVRAAETDVLRLSFEDLTARGDVDATTGFVTRERFRKVLDREVERADRLNRTLALLFFDLDDFKTLNDTHGIAAGDEYLRRLGEAVREEARSNDVPARLGGDEMALVLPDISANEAALRAESLVALISKLAPVFDGRVLNVTGSVGVAIYPDHASRASDLMLSADLAMHQAKRRGRSRFQMHDPHDRERDRIGLLRSQADRIREALAENRFFPVFQPVAEVATGRIVSVETLARLREADGTVAAPNEFLDAAERFGFVTAIDRVVIAKAFEQLAGVRKKGMGHLEMALNLSGLDFEDDGLVAEISRLARAKGVSPGKITFEITETAALRDFGRVQHFTRALTAEGFKFALDDFGIGFSSFRYLRDLPVATLKFDVSYIRNLPTRPENRVFVRGLADICRGLGIRSVAEGVETPEILSILRELGVDRAQGYFIGLPDPELPAKPGTE